MFTKNVYLSIVLIVTMAVGGCIPVPVWQTIGPKPSAIDEGKTTKARMLAKAGAPDAMTPDGRFFLYSSRKQTAVLFITIVGAIPVAGESNRRLLVEFDQNHVVKRRVIHKCEKKTADPICDLPNENALWAMIQELLGEVRAAQYRQAAMVARSLAESLHEAVKRGDLAEVKRLIAESANVHAQVGGRTPLHVAAREGYMAVAELLLAEGAFVDAAQAFDSRTPLHAAAEAGRTGVIVLLLAKGADVNARDVSEATPLHFGAWNGHVAAAERLLGKGADINAKTDTGHTPLYEAAEAGHIAITELLLAQGANVNAKGTEGTPLHAAAREGHVAVVKLLLANGARVDTKNKYRQTPLARATLSGHVAIVKELLAHGADVNAKDKKGRTPVGLATQARHQELTELLKRHGAKE